MGGIGTVSYQVNVGGGEAEKLLGDLRSAFPRLIVQLLSLPDKPNSKRIKMIASQTIRSIQKGTLLAGKPEVDIMLRLAGTTQISKAISNLGYTGSGSRVIVAMGARSDLKRFEKYAARNPERYRKTTGTKLMKADLEAVERAALLSGARS